jgi:hypothetical protein
VGDGAARVLQLDTARSGIEVLVEVMDALRARGLEGRMEVSKWTAAPTSPSASASRCCSDVLAVFRCTWTVVSAAAAM